MNAYARIAAPPARPTPPTPPPAPAPAPPATQSPTPLATHGPTPPATQSPTPLAAHGLTPLAAMLAAVAEAVRTPLPERPAAVARALARHAAEPGLLAGRDCPCNPDRYVRHLLHEGEGYAVVALVWRPGQLSPIHAHKAWCALAVHRGTMTEHHFAPGAPPRPTAARLLAAGDSSHGPADPDLIHRLGNCSAETAVTIHAYGVPYARFGQDLNLLLG